LAPPARPATKRSPSPGEIGSALARIEILIEETDATAHVQRLARELRL
jgi:hypothetical protein